MMTNNFLNTKYVIFLMGPTASGKSKIAMQLQKYLPVELISVDSALVYKEMDIGTAKPNNQQLLKHPLRLINLRDPKDFYSAANFRYDALKEIKEILYINKIPLLVGGSMFYYHILLYGLANLPSSNMILRKKILTYDQFQNRSNLHKYLSTIDIEAARCIHPHDIQRILRALEVYLMTGQKYSILKKKKKQPLSYKVIPLAIIPNKNYLYSNIDSRFYNMLKNGFEIEVRKLFNRCDLHINLPAMRCIGYQQMWLYFMNHISYNDMIANSIMATRQLVKKQITWLKKWKKVHFLYDNNSDILIQKIINIIYQYFDKKY